jgi:hypothetical protein
MCLRWRKSGRMIELINDPAWGRELSRQAVADIRHGLYLTIGRTDDGRSFLRL